MAKIADRILYWDSVLSEGVVNYYVRVIPDGQGFDYNHAPEFTVPHQTNLEEHEVNFAGLVIPEGTYDVFVTAVDGAGNESSPLEFADAVLDFSPPSAPASGGWR